MLVIAIILALVVLIAIGVTVLNRPPPPGIGMSAAPGEIALVCEDEDAESFDVVGESHYQAALEKVCGGRTTESAEEYCVAELRPESGNPYDDQAVAVFVKGDKVGYLNRPSARAFRADLARLGLPKARYVCDATVVGGWDRGEDDRGSFGIQVDLGVPMSIE